MHERSEPTILVVDDEEMNRKLMRALLTREGYRVLEAESGERALEVIEAGDPSLVLLDIVMPPPDGIETYRRLRQDLGRVDLPVVFVSALDERDSRMPGTEVGVTDFLTKPVVRHELLARVRALLDREEARP